MQLDHKVGFNTKKINTNNEDFNVILDKYIKRSHNYKILFTLFFIVFIILDIYPFISQFAYDNYEGGVLVTFMVLIIIGVWIYLLVDVLKYDLQNYYNNCLIEYEAKEEEKEQKEKQLNLLKEKYGDNLIQIKFNNDSLIVSEKNQCAVILGKEYNFSDIIGCTLYDNVQNKTITTSEGKAKTSTGNMIGRAVIGGVLTGGLGAVAGAATAKKNITTISTSQTITTHDYTIFVNINSLSNPTLSLKIGNDYYKTNKIINLLNVIVEQNKK